MEHPTDPVRVLHVDDEPDFAELAAEFLERVNDRLLIETATGAEEALDRLAEAAFECVVSDYDMPGQNGIEFLEAVRESDPDLPFILFTGKGSEEIASDAISAGVTDYLQKEHGTDQYTVLANRIENAVEQYRTERELDATRERMAFALEATDSIVFERDLTDGTETHHGPFEDLFGVPPETANTSEDFYAECVHPEDRTHVMRHEQPEAFDEAGETISYEFRTHPDNGDVRWLWTEAYIDTDPDGQPRRLIGLDTDITERKNSETRLLALLESLPDLAFIIDEEGRHVENLAGANAEALLVTDARELAGQRLHDVMPAEQAEELLGVVRDTIETGAAQTVEYELDVQAGSRWFEARTAPLEDRIDGRRAVTWVAREVTDRKQHERALAGLHEASDRLLRADTRTEACEAVIGIADAVLDHPYSSVYLWDEAAGRLRAEANSQRLLEAVGSPRTLRPGEGLVGEAFATGDRIVLEDAQEDPRTLETAGTLRGCCLVPLDGLGVLVIGSPDVGAFEQRDIELIELLAAHTAVALERIDREETLREREAELEAQNQRLEEVAAERQRAKARYESLFENNPVVIWEEDLSAAKAYVDGLAEEVDDLERYLVEHPEEVWTVFEKIEVLDVNETALEYYGAGSKTELTERIDDLVTEEAMETNAKVWAQIADGVTHLRTENVTRTLDGERRHELFELRVPEAYADDYSRAYINAVDISERKERERELEQSHQLIEALTTTFPDYTFIYNEAGEYLDVITGWEGGPNLFTPEELIGKTVEDVLPEETATRLRDAIGAALETGDLQTTEYTIETPGGTYRYEANLAPLPAGYEGEPAVVLSARDITERNERERKLERQNERLEEFANVVSHDLRNPLNVATVALERVKEECTSQHLETVDRAHGRMAALIDDVLALARQGKTVERPEAVDLAGLLEQCWGTVETAEGELVVDTDQVIHADRSRLAQLLENLLRNAVEHGGEDVTVTVGALEDRSGFYVADDGPGIPPEERDRIFEGGYSTRQEGTGFGLAIVQEITEAHGWDIRVTEREGGGARFEITGVDVGR